jgi:hypothetical protein
MAVTEPNITGSNMAPATLAGGRLRVAACVFTFASEAAGTYPLPIVLPKGARVWDVRFNLSASAGGTATIAIGITGAAGKYRAAATLTTTDSWVSAGLNAAMGAELTAAETINMTTAAAALPSSGRMVIQFVYSVD